MSDYDARIAGDDRESSGSCSVSETISAQPELPFVGNDPRNTPSEKTKFNFSDSGLSFSPDTAGVAQRAKVWQPKAEAVGASVGNGGQEYLVRKSSKSKVYQPAAGEVGRRSKRKARDISKLDLSKGFPGAREMGLPIKEAVEKYLTIKFNGCALENMLRSEIIKIDRSLDQPLKDYRKSCGDLPFGIKNIHENAHDIFDRAVESGIHLLPPAERRSALKTAARLSKD